MSEDATDEAPGGERDKLNAMDVALAAHPGSVLRRRLEDLHRVWDVWAAFSAELYALLEVCETHEPTASELTRNVGDRTVQQNTIRALDKAVIAYAAGLGALIDQTRIVVQQQPAAWQDQYEQKRAQTVGALPASPFLAKLRNYVLHYVAAPWAFHFSYSDGVMDGIVSLTTENLLRTEWPRPARAFIDANAPQLRLRPLLQPLAEQEGILTQWVDEHARSEHAAEFDAMEELIAERNLFLTGGATDGRDWEEQIRGLERELRKMRSASNADEAD
ncbi:hypothetical protein [Curtobacterium aetherium]|uniref:Uncharacterized protein n=1 Tax=Curtobacterium aetherium TaxID=2841594 RepID=A0ACD1E121_9MICO|nr:hypothetical protein [Curtobacterium sp. L6-1]QWS32605.1 hypothetical protein KM842_09910 [Curtobacterium sp. L6-1]